MGKLSDQIAAELDAADPQPETTEAKPAEAPPKEERPEAKAPEPAPEPKKATEEAPEPKKEPEGGDGKTPAKATPASKDEGKTPKEPASKPDAPRTFKLKLDGEEREYTEDQVVRLAQKAEVADKRFREASELKKDAQGFVQALQKDPLAMVERVFIKQHGDEERGIAAFYQAMIDRLKPLAERSQMPPEQAALAEERDRLARERRKHEEEKAAYHAQREREKKELADKEAVEKLDAAIQKHKFDVTDKKALAILQKKFRDAEKYEFPLEPEEAVLETLREIDAAKPKPADVPTSLPNLAEMLKDPARQAEARKILADLSQPSTPPFPSTPSKGEEPKEPKERAPRQKVYRTARDFHEAMEEVALHG